MRTKFAAVFLLVSLGLPLVALLAKLLHWSFDATPYTGTSYALTAISALIASLTFFTVPVLAGRLFSPKAARRATVRRIRPGPDCKPAEYPLLDMVLANQEPAGRLERSISARAAKERRPVCLPGDAEKVRRVREELANSLRCTLPTESPAACEVLLIEEFGDEQTNPPAIKRGPSGIFLDFKGRTKATTTLAT